MHPYPSRSRLHKAGGARAGCRRSRNRVPWKGTVLERVQKLSGTQKRLQAAIVNYAHDLVICCKGTADLAMQTMREVTKKLQLEVNEDKTRICRVPEESFDFLGYTFWRGYSRKTGKAYLGTTQSTT